MTRMIIRADAVVLFLLFMSAVGVAGALVYAWLFL